MCGNVGFLGRVPAPSPLWMRSNGLNIGVNLSGIAALCDTPKTNRDREILIARPGT
jgi:hypothetical protein